MNRIPFALLAILLLWLALSQQTHAHGGVVEEEDLCVIKVNYLRGHFKIYQPQTTGHEEFCEDLPAATESIFVMEYLHDSLGEAAVDFRIIRDVTGKGRFARWEDVAAIDDLQAATVYYREPVIDPDVFSVIYDFEDEGDYIGVVTANVDGEEQIYRAVFPFEVGYTGFGYWPFFIVLLLAIQLQYFITSGRLKRWRENHRSRSAGLGAVLLLLVFATADTWAGEWTSKRGIYTVSFESSLEPIEINRIHTWVLHISAEDGPIVGADLNVVGGMPEHNHGLPTSPRVTEDIGEGNYRLEGMRFHMQGLWTIDITISADGKTDTVTIELRL
jgi:hypothetical protein